MQWSPTNPALFACADGTGRLDLWNLINDAEVPTASLMIEGSPALNKLRWSQNGHQIAVGDDQGKISLIDVNEAYANSRADDWSRMVKVLADLKRSTAEMEEANGGSSGGGGGGGGTGTPGGNSAQNTPNTPSSSVLQQQQSAMNTPSVPLLTSVKSEPNFEYRMANVNVNFASPPTNFIPQIKQSPPTSK